LPRKEESTEGS